MGHSTETEDFRRSFLKAFRAQNSEQKTTGSEEMGDMLIGKGDINWVKSAVNGTAYTVFFLVIFKLFAMIDGLQATINENNRANVEVIQRTVEAQIDLKHSINLLVNTLKDK